MSSQMIFRTKDKKIELIENHSGHRTSGTIIIFGEDKIAKQYIHFDGTQDKNYKYYMKIIKRSYH